MCSTHTMLTVLSNLSRSLSSVVHASVGASVFSLYLQACRFGDESSKRALVKFDLGRVSLASRADTSAARRAVSSFTVCGDAVVAGAVPAEPCPCGPPAPVGLVVPAVCCELAPLGLLPRLQRPPLLAAPPAPCTDGGTSLAGRGSSGAGQSQPRLRAARLVEEAGGEQGCWATHIRAVSLFNYRLK